MTAHERFLKKLAQIAAEYEEKLRPKEMLLSRLRWEDWEGLRGEAVGFAKAEIRRRRWRGRRGGGVLPEGYDAEGIVNEVIGEMLEGKCRLVLGFTREKVVKELKRLVGQRVRVLHRLKEAGSERSEWRVVDGRPRSLLGDVQWVGEGVEEEVWRHEEESRREGIIRSFEELLKPEPDLLAVFRCLYAGVEESKEIGRQLEMAEAAVVKARKKLARRAGEFERRMKMGQTGGKNESRQKNGSEL